MSLARKTFDIEIGGKPLTLEFSALAEQANAAVIGRYGGTAVLATVVMGEEQNTDYLPLKVDYEEKFYAAGKIIGSRFIRREGKASDDAVLAGRLVDRVIRPLFDHRIRRELQVVVTVLSYDEENEPDFVGLIAASAALATSDIPWNGPVGGIRVGKIGEKFVVNPANPQLSDKGTVFHAFVAGPAGRINMVELEGSDAAEKDVLGAFEHAQKEIDRLVEFQKKIVAEVGKPKKEVAVFEPDSEVRADIEEFLAARLEEALYAPSKMAREEKLAAMKRDLVVHMNERHETMDPRAIDFVLEEALDILVHKNILENDKRPDGRKLDEIRQLDGEVGLFPRTHGSALFVRGNTQALAITTLAAPGAEQLVETMTTTGKRRFMLHYNFPPYSVGEIGNFRGPGRREIGHGALAEKTVRPLLPPQEEFPYTIRVVSEAISSNGSTSMATVCASILSLMDAGVPIKKPAAGIAMGLMMTDDAARFKVLTDLQGPEDFYGDMDFKVAGTRDGVNAIQLDVKIHGLTIEIVGKTLVQAREARMKILDVMAGVLPAPRSALSPNVPAILQTAINPEKIGMVIGPGGKVINGLIKKWVLDSIDIEEDGRVFVSGKDMENAKQALEEIKMMTREFKVGEIIEGRVIKALDFGAIVDLGGGQDGMIHVSELKEGFVKKVEDVVRVGDFVKAKIIRVEDGRIGLSMKQVTEGTR